MWGKVGCEVKGRDGEGAGKAPARVTFISPDWTAEKGPPREEEAGRLWAEGPPPLKAWGLRAEGPVCLEDGRCRGWWGKLWPGQFGLSCRGSSRSPVAGRRGGACLGTRSCAGVVRQPPVTLDMPPRLYFTTRPCSCWMGGPALQGSWEGQAGSPFIRLEP